MRLTYRGSQFTLEVEVGSLKEALACLSEFGGVIGQSVCGACGSDRVRYVVREAQSYTFYECACCDCSARLSFGQTKDGRLYPRRKDKDGNWLPNNGWVKFERSD